MKQYYHIPQDKLKKFNEAFRNPPWYNYANVKVWPLRTGGVTLEAEIFEISGGGHPSSGVSIEKTLKWFEDIVEDILT